MERFILHCDANSAYLSWTATQMLQDGYPVDIRTVPAVVAGDPNNRHGIILAKSIPAKTFGIQTGESLFEARQKCPDLLIVPPDYDLYMSCSQAMYEILVEYSPVIERYSIDECFVDYTRSYGQYGEPVLVAQEIRRRMKEELGFTVNLGVAHNRLLAKMASELRKPDQVHTLWEEEIPEKMWPLPVGELYMVGRATRKKLNEINIHTIGQLANADPIHLQALMKSHGRLVHQYANGIDDSAIIRNEEILQKGIGNSITTSFDVDNYKEAQMVLLALTERATQRMRKLGCMCGNIAICLKTDQFFGYSHQRSLDYTTKSTQEVFRVVSELLQEAWNGSQPLRQLGVRLSQLCRDDQTQLSLFCRSDPIKEEQLDAAVDQIRKRYGDSAIMRGCFSHSGFSPLQGGTNDGNYIGMGGYGS